MAKVERPEFPGDFYRVLLTEPEAEYLAGVFRALAMQSSTSPEGRLLMMRLGVDLD